MVDHEACLGEGRIMINLSIAKADVSRIRLPCFSVPINLLFHRCFVASRLPEAFHSWGHRGHPLTLRFPPWDVLLRPLGQYTGLSLESMRDCVSQIYSHTQTAGLSFWKLGDDHTQNHRSFTFHSFFGSAWAIFLPDRATISSGLQSFDRATGRIVEVLQ